MGEGRGQSELPLVPSREPLLVWSGAERPVMDEIHSGKVFLKVWPAKPHLRGLTYRRRRPGLVEGALPARRQMPLLKGAEDIG